MEFNNMSDFAFPTESSKPSAIWYNSMSLNIAFTVIAIVFGVPLKALMIYIGVRHHRDRPGALNVLVISLMIAGLCLLLLVLPFHNWTVVNGSWIFGNTFCKIYGYIGNVLAYALPFHILCITFILLSEAMLPDLASKLDKCVVTCVGVSILWLVGFLANIPHYISFHVPPVGFQRCFTTGTNMNTYRFKQMLYFVILCVIPVLGVTYCTTVTILYTMATSSGDFVPGTSRTRRGIAIPNGALTLAMWVLFFPLPVLNLLSLFQGQQMHKLRLVFDVLYLCKHAVFPVVVTALLLVCVGDYISICKSIFRSAFGQTCRSSSREGPDKTTPKEEETQNIMKLETV